MLSAGQIRVGVTDGIAANRKQLCERLLPEPDIEVVGVARNGDETLRLIEALAPQVLVLNPMFLDQESLRLIETLTARWPDIAVILVAVMNDPAYLQRAYQAGAKVVLPWLPAAGKLAEAIRRSSGG